MSGTFGAGIAALDADVAIDLICFTAASARQLLDALRPTRPLLVHCGTIWVHGPALRVPMTEDEPRTGYGEYGTGKVEIEALLQRETRTGGVPAIVLHHVHADDVAQAFELALSRPQAIGSSFHVVAEQAMTLRGLAAGVAQWFGREPVLDFVDWAEFEGRVGSEHAGATREHTFRGIAASIARARQTLGYAPRFSSLDALYEALAWLVANGQADIGGQPFAGA
ncbi:MAG TPA: hypothetical protein VGH27_27485 [Streptosporangiaceae bacterium]|jgi:nucleoside-diphosphate-sugar epimerase